MNIQYLETTYFGHRASGHLANSPRVQGPVLEQLRVKNIENFSSIFEARLYFRQ